MSIRSTSISRSPGSSISIGSWAPPSVRSTAPKPTGSSSSGSPSAPSHTATIAPSVAGGVWKSDDAGQYWENITDGYLNTASIGALAVAPSDGNVIYAGTGGHGVYLSKNDGDAWSELNDNLAESLGLDPQTRGIAIGEVIPGGL